MSEQQMQTILYNLNCTYVVCCLDSHIEHHNDPKFSDR